MLTKKQIKRIAYRMSKHTPQERREVIIKLKRELGIFRTASEFGIIDGNIFWIPAIDLDNSFQPTPDELLLLAYLGLKMDDTRANKCKKLLDFNDSKFSRVMRSLRKKGYVIEGTDIPYFTNNEETWKVMFDEYVLSLKMPSTTKVLYAFLLGLMTDRTIVSNEFITKYTGIKTTSITKHLNVLEEHKLIQREKVSEDGRVKRVIIIL